MQPWVIHGGNRVLTSVTEDKIQELTEYSDGHLRPLPVQRLRLSSPKAGGLGSILGRGTKILSGVEPKKEKKRKQHQSWKGVKET